MVDFKKRPASQKEAADMNSAGALKVLESVHALEMDLPIAFGSMVTAMHSLLMQMPNRMRLGAVQLATHMLLETSQRSALEGAENGPTH